MLLDLSLKDFVLVDRSDLALSPGFTALTGETGAGKSILLDALGFLLGGRADTAIVRHGRDKAEVAATFAMNPNLAIWLTEQDFSSEGELQLRRTLDTTGRSRCAINGSPCTASQLRELGEQLLTIHGQHEHQQLLKPASQRALVDDFAKNQTLRTELSAAWKALNLAQSELAAAHAHASNADAQREQLSWELDALQLAAPVAGEWAALEEEHTRLSNSTQLISTLQQVLASLDEAEDALTERSRSLHHSVEQLSKFDPATAALAEPIETAHIHLQEAARGIQQYLKRADADPERLAEVDARVSSLHACARKLKLTPAELPERLVAVSAQFAALNQAQDLNAMQAAVIAAQSAYDAGATRLSASRAAAAKRLSAAVSAAMQDLALSGGQFEARVSPAAPSGTGVDSVEFWVTANLGQPLRLLGKVASGGELARMSLALCVVTAAQNAVPCLIFDEVDSGIGGATADIVGQHLRQLGVSVQVLAVTHLAQVAANAHHHLKVAKHTADGRTLSNVTPLDEPQRVDEIARMLGGEQITVTTRHHAQEMLSTAFHRFRLAA